MGILGLIGLFLVGVGVGGLLRGYLEKRQRQAELKELCV